MSYKPKTSCEIEVFHIEKTLRKLKNNKIPIKGCGLNKRLGRLKTMNPYLHEDLMKEYIEIVKNK